jgi:bacteriorhodopsin
MSNHWIWIVLVAVGAVCLVITVASYISMRSRLRMADRMAATIRNETIISNRGSAIGNNSTGDR